MLAVPQRTLPGLPQSKHRNAVSQHLVLRFPGDMAGAAQRGSQTSHSLVKPADDDNASPTIKGLPVAHRVTPDTTQNLPSVRALSISRPSPAPSLTISSRILSSAAKLKTSTEPPTQAPNTISDRVHKKSTFQVADINAALEGKYDVGERLGRGTFANVYKAWKILPPQGTVTNSETKINTDAGETSDAPQQPLTLGEAVAVKVVRKSDLDVETTRLLENELDVLRTVSQHPGVVTLLESFETDEIACFVLEYVAGGQLLDQIVQRGSFSENDARVALKPVVRTLEYLAALGLVHRDIKPENMLVDDSSNEWPVKLTDFGLSAKLQKNELLYSMCGTPMFVAPEVIRNQGYDSACDMWSVGVTLYTILCGYPPFFHEDVSTLIGMITNDPLKFPPKEWDLVSRDAKDLLEHMLVRDPAKRISAADALAHPWFKVAQSTAALPNNQLKGFNARRKMRSAVLCVRTTFDFWDLIRPENKEANQVRSKALVEEVRQNAARIAEMERTEKIRPNGKQGSVVSPGPAAPRCTTGTLLPQPCAATHSSTHREPQNGGNSTLSARTSGEAAPDIRPHPKLSADSERELEAQRDTSARTSQEGQAVAHETGRPRGRRSLILPTVETTDEPVRPNTRPRVAPFVGDKARAMIAEIGSGSHAPTWASEPSPFREDPAPSQPSQVADRPQPLPTTVSTPRRTPRLQLSRLNLDGL